MNTTAATPIRLRSAEWKSLADKHRASVERWSLPFRERRRVSQSHLVHDFLFVYYRFSPAKLEQWHPGLGITLVDAAQHLDLFGEDNYSIDGNDIIADPQKTDEKVRARLEWTANLLRQTQNRKPNFSCLGLHEWAMVYRGQDIRHEKTTKLRLPQSEIDSLVESRSVTCTHFDAFRFFALDAKPLNRVQPTLESRPDMEQPACIHANMDLYKWAFKSMPWVGSDLLLRCFELAMHARAIDMRASPYDLSNYREFPPIKIETPEGRAQYEQLQREIADRAAPLREELATSIEKVIAHFGDLRT